RLREERNKGANLATAIRNGYDRAFPTIIDTHLTSIFTAIVLYTFGNDQLKGFAISLTVVLIISLITSLYMTRLMFDYWQHRHWLKVDSVRWVNRPASGDLGAVGTYEYEISYADQNKTRATVSLTEKPAGDTETQMDDNVKQRAARLPDVSVEQIFLSTDPTFP